MTSVMRPQSSLIRAKKKGGPCGPPFVMHHRTSMDQKRWVYFMYT